MSANTYSESDRYVYVDSPTAPPGCCFFCRKADAKGYVDLRMQSEHPVGIAMDGAVYICVECVTFISGLFGLVPENEKALELNQQLAESLHKVDNENQILRSTLNEFLNAGMAVPDGLANNVNHLLSLVETQHEDTAETIRGLPKKLVESNPGLTESTDDETVGELRPAVSIDLGV